MEPEILVLAVALLALAAYAVFGGADFGAGIHDLIRPRGRSDRDWIYHAIGPVWEANHVWLIFVLIILWSAFPVAFAGMCRVAFVPLLLALVGIIFRGAAYAFRNSVSRQRTDSQPAAGRVWEVVFAGASIAAPFFMGVTIGTLANEHPLLAADGSYAGNPLTGWFRAESLYFGFFAVAICAFMAAVFLHREADLSLHLEQSTRWRRRALITGTIAGAMALGGLVVAQVTMPALWAGMGRWGWAAVVLSLVCGTATIVLTVVRRPTLAAATACVTVAAVIAGWGLSHYPLLVAPNISIAATAAPDNVLWLLLGSIGVGMALVAPSLWWLLRLFKSEQQLPH